MHAKTTHSLNVHTTLHHATSVFVCLQPDEPDGDEIKSRKADAQKGQL